MDFTGYRIFLFFYKKRTTHLLSSFRIIFVCVNFSILQLFVNHFNFLDNEFQLRFDFFYFLVHIIQQ